MGDAAMATDLTPAVSEEAIFTLHITGLPPDVKTREIFSLFRSVRGYEFCNLRSTASGVSAFATFLNSECAGAALAQFDGQVFDPDTGVKLKLEFAKSNSRKRTTHDSSSHDSWAPEAASRWSV